MNVLKLLPSHSYLVLVCALSSVIATGQVAQDVFERQGGIEISVDTDYISTDILDHPGIELDHGTTRSKAKLYVDADGYKYLVDNNVPFDYLPRHKPQLVMKDINQILRSHKSECMPDINYYPTYEAYAELMNSFQEAYPDLCRIINIGTLESGRELLVAQIGDDLDQVSDEPNFFYTSTMHGDELAGFPIMIQYIDYLLCNYDSDDRVRHLVDNINIYINPLANPDGTYQNDNSTVEGAKRRNVNGVDLNRNYPDPKDGPNPDGRPTQPETMFFTSFTETAGINLSCNIHSGAEVVNYPWDTWLKRHADDSWWHELCRAYADTCQHYGPDSYMTDLDNGVTNGFDWYEVAGGRQDHACYFQRSREMTLEITSRKIFNPNGLPSVWEANRPALLNYMEQSLFGLRGVVTDCETGIPIEAEIFIPGHDTDNTSVYSDAEIGKYFRYLDDGAYNVGYVAEGYDTVWHEVVIIDKQTTRIDIGLCPLGMSRSEDTTLDDIQIAIVDNQLKLTGTDGEVSIILSNTSGQNVLASSGKNKMIYVGDLPAGIYYVQLQKGNARNVMPIAIH